MGNNIKNKELNNAGFTLVEMVVAFALLALFMVAVTRIISYTVSLYHTTQASANGLEVSSMISNKIVAMLEDAKEVELEDSGNSITIVDQTDTKVTISVESDFVNIFYHPVTTPSGEILKNSGGEDVTPNWKFDDNAYMGFVVKELTFQRGDFIADSKNQKGVYPDNVIKMVLTVHSDKYGDNDYTTTTYIKCPALDGVPQITPTPTTP